MKQRRAGLWLAIAASLPIACVGRVGVLPGADGGEAEDGALRDDVAPGTDTPAARDTATPEDTATTRRDTAVPRDTATPADVFIPGPDVPTCVPSTEVCNGRDDDCDGATDEDLGQTSCGMGPCRRTVDSCAGGVAQTCTPNPSSPETCNGVDDDCDGTVDDGLAPQAFCGGRCVDTRTDAAHCGGCARACAAGSTCMAGTCSTTSGEPVFLRLVNAARAMARDCGGTMYPAVPALTWDARLEAASRAHSVDMATNNFFSHTGSDGSSVGARVTRAGYRWSAVGENIAAGQRTPEAAMTSWLESPGHCRNIMSSNYTQIGVAEAMGGSYGIYWTMDLARP